MKTNFSIAARSFMASALALMSFSAFAAPVSVDVNIIVPGVYQPPQPIYVAPRPVYVQERPVYVQERPVYVQERPVYIQQRPVYVEHEDGYWDCKKDKCKHKRSKKEKHREHDDD